MDRGAHWISSSGDPKIVGNHDEKNIEGNDDFRSTGEQAYLFDYEDLQLRKGKWTVSCPL